MRGRLQTAGLRVAPAALPGTLAALPLLWRGPSCGHDFDFHLQSWLAVRQAWQAALPVPHWVAAANYGAGEARFVFYPPLSWLLGAALGWVLPWVWVPAAYTGLCVAGAAAATHRLAVRFCSPAAATLVAALYALSPYLLFTAYERAAYGELLAAVWMPLLLEALLRPRLPVPRVAVLVALLWYTNAPAAVMGCYLVVFAVLFAVVFAARSRWRAGALEALRGGVAVGLGCALAADYLLPAWYEQRFVAIARAVGPGMRVEDSFLFGHTGEPFHDQVLHSASLIAIATFAVALAGAGGLLVRRRMHRASASLAFGTAKAAHDAVDSRSSETGMPAREAQETHTAVWLLALLAVCALLQLPLSRAAWHLLPELQFLQFPWRLLLIASAAAALLPGLALRSSGTVRRRRVLACCTLLFAAGLVGWAAQTRYQPCDEEDNVTAQLALPASGKGFAGTDEYAAAGSDNGEIQQGLPRVRLLRSPDADEGSAESGSGTDADATNPAWHPRADAREAGTVQVTRWDTEHVTVHLHPAVDAYAVLRLQAFPAWQVLLNGAPCANACVPRDDGLLTVRVAACRGVTLDARYRTTADVLWGRAVSAAAVLLLLLWRSGRRRPKPQL